MIKCHQIFFVLKLLYNAIIIINLLIYNMLYYGICLF